MNWLMRPNYEIRDMLICQTQDVYSFQQSQGWLSSSVSQKIRHWSLVLERRPSLISHTLSVTVFSSIGSHQVPSDFSSILYFEGFVLGHPDSSVSVTWDDDLELFSARITLPDDTYFLEPLSLYSEYQTNMSLLFYRLRDIRSDQFTQTVLDDQVSSDITTKNTVQENNQKMNFFSRYLPRKKRTPESSDNKLCSLTFIADYLFFENVGDRSEHKTTRIIITLFHRLNALYQSTKFLLDETVEEAGYGFLLADAFNRADLRDTCLAHLLTYRPFMGILGRAWTAAPGFGGICSPKVKQNNEEFHANTGWTTYVDHSGRRLLNAMAELITAHELGHNWGADHDPDTDECSPSASSRGKYLMYAHSVGGFAENNYKFSPCSLRTIGATLAVRAPLCFVGSSEATLGRCGNRRLDAGEECDTGGAVTNECCTPNCKLRPGARCSPWNHDCCTSESRKFYLVLRATDPVSGLLLLNRCVWTWLCLQGQCQFYCARHGLKTCICDSVDESCFICCLISFPGHSLPVCKPMQHTLQSDSKLNPTEYTAVGSDKRRMSFVPPSTDSSPEAGQSQARRKSIRFKKSLLLKTKELVYLHLDDHRPCTTGFCMHGVCQASKANLILRFWGLYDKVSDNALELLVRNNLVVLIVSLSLLIWIPSAIGVRKWKQRIQGKTHVNTECPAEQT
ncbi:Tumor necrosis factor-alpha-converting enzyme [Fasciola gigantica]|uniref:Tumor necrosis factor-alpha-converting enzyme n=1 Tax=Fasciola gigantica TaxID=46835 RepID=A0A504YH06_FASGI|nr:Tumor necrosis factor-alpha-converting enzyme [Fasciola gigantica]